tara:strand:+ start:2558 stop:3151 length:594 start_codon:yes stop_codon:yes gene_type:complete
VRGRALIVIVVIVLCPIASAHEAKDYTVLLRSDGTSPANIPDGVLVTTDRIFFMMVDAGGNKSQQILVDVDGDGNFSGSDDIHSPILTSSCALDNEGNKSDPECAVTYTLEMGPSNGLLPGTVSFMIQHMNGTDVSDNVSFTAHFSEDNHIEEGILIQPTEEVTDSSSREVVARAGLAIGALFALLFTVALIRQGRE